MNDEINKNVLKTGTLTVGIVCKDGIVIGADKKVTYGGGGGVSYIADKLRKIVQINDRLIATIAGGAADAKKISGLVRAELRLKELRTKELISVEEAANFLANIVYQAIRTPSMIPSITHFLVAGYDPNGYHLFDIGPDGHVKSSKTYATSGSGIMQADAILDSEYKEGITLDEGLALAEKCIKASSGRDPSVGLGIDLFTVTKDKITQVVDKEAILNFDNTK